MVSLALSLRLWQLLLLCCLCDSFSSKFNVVYDNSNEGKPYLSPEGGDSRYEIGRSLCHNENGMAAYAGVRGMLTDGDCAALYHLASYVGMKWKRVTPNEDLFRYVETGSYQGLSAHIVATSLKSSIGLLNSVIYSHDLFEFIPSKESSIIEQTGLWTDFMEGSESRLQKFYSNVQRNGFEKTIIPVSGPSSRTLKIHPNNSIHLIFIDGDHTYEGMAWSMLTIFSLMYWTVHFHFFSFLSSHFLSPPCRSSC
jgi:hypothetical protein